MSDPYDLDAAAIRRTFSRAAATYDDAAALQTEVRGRLLERLQLIRGTPGVILELGAGTARASRELKGRFPAAQVIALDAAFSMLAEARRQQRFFRKFRPVCADANALPFANQSIDWCVSNLMLAWCEPIDSVIAEAQRVLKPGGLFAFTSFGPDTLRELRIAWAAIDSGPHVHRFIDMHDLGDALVRSGFAEPVMDVERIVLTFENVPKLFQELKRTGLATATQGRVRHLGMRASHRSLVAAYESLRAEQRIPATFEIVYGHAWRSADAQRVDRSDEVMFPVSKIGRRR